ncbi:hypothetical protein B0T17DRAFT_495399 [Bombardia bombarda]|uniref:Uncharacterized protein n=1 Tax=Bombardia bombarda TaxID=252184 RepID=A0AA39WM28_9PEZI|nr:hypothetical protein B0T17DRAFT_495399 [Bombardia bombarda]
MATANPTNYPPPAPPHSFQSAQQLPYQPQYQAQQYQSPQGYQSFPQQQQQQQQQATPAQQRPAPQTQTRKSRSISFRSDKSHGSNGNNKLDLHETSKEKEAKRIHSKADPTLAMNEAEPSAVAATVKSSLASIRAMQHRDSFGNPIAEPDRSNPTRSRWERPLDTIRSFEAAIDGNYSNRRSIYRSALGNNRRSSYYGANSMFLLVSPSAIIADKDQHRCPSYYASRPPSMMYANRNEGSHSLHDLRQANMGGPRDAYQDQQSGYNNGYPPVSQNNGRRGHPRMISEPQSVPAYRQQQQNPNEYTLPSNHRSYETVASASGSGTSAEPAGYQTDPTSSDNSSIERMQSGPNSTKRAPEPVNDYGIGFGQNTDYQAPTFSVGLNSSPLANGGETNNYQASGALNGYQSRAPVPPVKDRGSTILRKPTTNDQTQLRPPQPEKRKSWLARRFSKRD